MKSGIAHIQINVNPDNLPFYEEFTGFLGWSVIHSDDGMLGVNGASNISLWFVDQVNNVQNDYDGPGTNHISLSVDVQSDVDLVASWLKDRGIEHLFETPRHRPEFSHDDTSTYYQVMFESPDKLLFEVVYTGPKA
ncbi:MAG: VOC family protein [Thermomicrobiales bacterium]